ncbi:ogr/Delta-like zinc finger family protein [Verminephrobacter aporrectodeae]|nr:ogr/Delta-like zinc finger family protein [Verminephrobacter aporrectodeae]
MRCPHCQFWSSTRTSVQVTDLSRESVFVCRNFECGHVFSCVTTVNRTLSLSSKPNPKVHLPLSSHIKRALMAHQLATLPSSDYAPQNSPPSTPDLFDPLPPRPG